MKALRVSAAQSASVVMLLLAIAGCGGESFQLAEAEGIVTLKGLPLGNLRVEFWPLGDGPQSAALTDAEGRFVLSTLDSSGPGAVVGRHKVVLRDVSIFTKPFQGRQSADVDLTGGQKPRIAVKYSNVTTTPLEVDIPGEIRDIALEVEPFRR